MPTGVHEDGYNLFADNLFISLPTSDNFVTCPPSDFTAVPVTNITYSQDQVAGASGTTISTEKLVDASANATAKLHLDLTNILNRAAAGKGATITSITLFYEVLAAVLTASPAVAIVSQTFGAAGSAGAAPTAAATAGGTITSTPASPPTAVSTAGQFYTATYALGTPLDPSSNLARAYAEITVPMTVGGTVHVAGAVVNYTLAAY